MGASSYSTSPEEVTFDGTLEDSSTHEQERSSDDTRRDCEEDNMTYRQQESNSKQTYSASKEKHNQIKKRKQLLEYKALEIEQRKVQLLEKRIEDQRSKHRDDDDDYLFLMSLLPSIKQLDDIQKMHLRMEFLSAVTKKIEEKKYRGSTVTHLQNYASSVSPTSASATSYSPTPSPIIMQTTQQSQVSYFSAPSPTIAQTTEVPHDSGNMVSDIVSTIVTDEQLLKNMFTK